MMHRRVTKLIPLLVIVLSLVFVSVAFAAHRDPLRAASLTGAEEVPGPGDPDGSGYVTIRLHRATGRVCWNLSVEDIDPATAAHIHVGAAGVAGPVVVTLSPPSDGHSKGCAEGVDRALIKNIIQHPEEYYVNVHNPAYPAGAVRGQLANRGQAHD